jgi:23S rRNA (uracil1939-C5)-methyltransferase
VGTFLLPLARSARRGVGVESDGSAFADARYNQRQWRLQRLDLYERKVERILPRLLERGTKADIVVLDPPRKGCGPIVCTLTAKLSPRRIILISCDPATLARDLKSLAGYGYMARRVQPVDMFPQTWHVETVTVCDRSG